MKRLVLLVIAVAILVTGRSMAKEPDELALVRVLGVDGSSPVELTAVCGGDDQEEDISRGSYVGEDFQGALVGLPWANEEGKKELSLTSVTYLVVSRDVDLEEILLEVLQDKELAGLSTVWLADEGAAALLEDCEDPAAALSLLTRQGVSAPTAAKALAALSTDGRAALPVLGAGESGPEWLGTEEWRAA